MLMWFIILSLFVLFFFKQKTAYEMRISDWSSDVCSSDLWAADATAAIADAHDSGRLPILVGGTGLYLRTLLDGIAPVPDIDPHIHAEVRAMPVAAAHAALEKIDPAAAARLAPADTKIGRAHV